VHQYCPKQTTPALVVASAALSRSTHGLSNVKLVMMDPCMQQKVSNNVRRWPIRQVQTLHVTQACRPERLVSPRRRRLAEDSRPLFETLEVFGL